ncbi:hypothetical protein Tco_0495886 [Tanacetum coccineum]
MIVDIEDDIIDPVMQCTTLPSHSGFSQKKLVSFVTEIHTLSIDISLRDLKMEILLEPTSNKLMVDVPVMRTSKHGESNTSVLEDPYAFEWRPLRRFLNYLIIEHKLIKEGSNQDDSSQEMDAR